MQIDYVRVYQCQPEKANDANYTGEGCATVNPDVKLNTDAGHPGSHEFVLFDDGVIEQKLMADEESITNQLVIGSDNANAKLVSDSKRGQVLQLDFANHGKGYLQSQDMSKVDGLESALWLAGGSGWTIHGEVKFDMKVLDAGEDSKFLVKLASSEEQKGSATIEIPQSGEWTPVSVKISDILKNPLPENGGVDMDAVAKPFVLEHQGTGAGVQLDNIRLKCAYNTEPEDWQIHKTCVFLQRATPPEPIYYSVNDKDWLVWGCCGGAKFSMVEDNGEKVIEYRFGKASAAPGLQALRPLELTEFANGYIEFDLKQVNPPPVGSPWYIKLEAKASGGQVLLTEGGLEPTEEWQHYKFPLSGGLGEAELSNIKQVMIFPEWAKSEGAVMRLKNFKFTKDN